MEALAGQQRRDRHPSAPSDCGNGGGPLMRATNCTWNRQELGEGLATLARASGMSHAPAKAPASEPMEHSVELATFFRQQAQLLDVRLEPAGTRYGMLSTMLRPAAPPVVRVQLGGGGGVILVWGRLG